MTSIKFDWKQHLETRPNDLGRVTKSATIEDGGQKLSIRTFYKNMHQICQDYCKTSSVHGVRYFTEPKRHWIERLWWIIAMICSVVGTILVSKEVYNKWQKSPVIVSFAEKYTRVSEIPFPAVTICPETKARLSILNFTELHDRWVHNGLEKLEDEEKEGLEKMIAVLQICSDSVNLELKESKKYEFTKSDIYEIIQEVAPTFNETLILCKFQNQEKPCRDYFKEVITEEGLCYTFNSLEFSEIYRDAVYDSQEFVDRTKQLVDNWSLDKGYTALTNSSYPLRVFGSGSRDGLTVTLSLNQSDFDEKCRSHVQGFKVQLHMPGVIPQLSKHYFHLPMQRDVLISVNPEIIKTDEDLDHYKPEIRQCYFSQEKRLQFFQDYTKSNCDFECLTNFTLLKCGCVRFSMPRIDKTKICGIKNIDCCIDAEDELLRKDDGLLGNNEFDDCNCLPSCSSYSYGVDQSHNIIKTKFELFDEKEIAIMRIFFNKKQFISSKRSKLYGQTELLANFGGLLGFFLGISLLSFVEIIYFFTLRTYLLLKKNFVTAESTTQATYKTTIKATETESNVKINIIRPSSVNSNDPQSQLTKKRNTLFMQRRSVSGRNDAISQGFY